MKWPVLMITACLLLLAGQHLLSDAKRVVQFPSFSTSHVKYNIKVARALQDLGHQVWIVLPEYFLNRKSMDLSNITTITFQMNEVAEDRVVDSLVDMYFSGVSGDKVMQSALPLFRDVCDNILRDKDLEKKIRDVSPDLMVMGNIPLIYTLAVLPYKLQVPFAMLGVAYVVHYTRIPYSSAANSSPFLMMLENATFLERLKSMLVHALFFVQDPFMPADAVSLYAPEMPYISNSELMARAELWLVDMDHILDYPRPALPNVKLIGGTMSDLAKPLPSKLQDFMDEAKQGAVVVTFGSIILGLPEAISSKLFRVFLNLPFRVVFRSNLTSPYPDKVWTSDWLPQNDLLGHPNTKLFVSHCGSNGQYEALFHAVPLLCMPVFGDQPYNGERIRRKGFGEVVDLRTVTEEELFTAIMTVAREPRYKLAISKASTLFRQQYGFPMKEAAKWLDHVMEYGGEYMRYAGQKMRWVIIYYVKAYVFFRKGHKNERMPDNKNLKIHITIIPFRVCFFCVVCCILWVIFRLFVLFAWSVSFLFVSFTFLFLVLLLLFMSVHLFTTTPPPHP